MEEMIYLATVEPGFQLDENTKAYFASKNIVVERFFEQLGIVKLRTNQEISTDNLRHITHFEKDSTMVAQPLTGEEE